MPAPAFLARQFAHPSGLFGRFVAGRMLNRATMAHTAMVFEDLKVERASRVLEVGFGGGSLLERLCPAVPDGLAAGVEVSDEMLAMVRRRLNGFVKSGRLDLRRGGIERLPFADSTFDRGCTVNTTYFWPDLSAGLGEFHRVLRPCAVLVIGFLAPEDIKRAGLEAYGYASHSGDEMGAALQAAGFRVASLRNGRDMRGRTHSLAAERLA